MTFQYKSEMFCNLETTDTVWHLSKEINRKLSVSINFVKMTWNVVLILDPCCCFYLSAFSGCNIKRGNAGVFFTSPWHFWQSFQIWLCSKKKYAHVLYVISGTYRYLDIVEKNVCFKSIQQWFPEQEKWQLQKHIVQYVYYFHFNMYNSIVDINREEGGERKNYVPLRMGYEQYWYIGV